MATEEIKTYILEIYAGDQTANLRASITLFDAKKDEMGTLGFVEDGPIPANIPGGIPVAYYPVSRYADVVDMLRNESPVYLVYGNGDQVSITTASENIGDGERLATSRFVPIGSKVGL